MTGVTQQSSGARLTAGVWRRFRQRWHASTPIWRSYKSQKHRHRPVDGDQRCIVDPADYLADPLAPWRLRLVDLDLRRLTRKILKRRFDNYFYRVRDRIARNVRKLLKTARDAQSDPVIVF